MKGTFYILLVLVLTSCGQEKTCIDADLLLFNSTIYTADSRNSIVEAVAVKEDSIIFVGSNKEGES